MDTEHQQLTSEIENAYGVPLGHDPRNPLFNVTWDMDRDEGDEVNLMKATRLSPLPEPIIHMDDDQSRNVIVTSVDYLLNWARKSSLFPLAVRSSVLRLRDDCVRHGAF